MLVFETIECKLITKSPIHIGSHEQQITRYEFVTEGNNLYPISDERLALFLQRKNLITEYCAEIEREGSRFVMAEFLKKKAVKPTSEELLELSAGRKLRVIGDVNQIQEYKPFIRDAFNNPFIPGSSIKGVLRTAVLYKILKSLKRDNPSKFKNEIENKIEQMINQDPQGKNKKEFFSWAEKRFLQGFNLLHKREQPNTDWFRIFKVSDAYSYEKVNTVLLPVSILKKEATWTYKYESEGKKTRLWIECIPEGVEFKFKINIDKNLINEFYKGTDNLNLPRSTTELLETLRDWAQDLVEFEKNFFSNHALKLWYERNPSNFRIGAGSGMISTTMIMLFDEKLRVKIRDYSGGPNPSSTAPKSRKVHERDNTNTPLGWCLLKVEK